MPSYTTACPRNCYSTCTMTVHVEDGRLRSIEAHPDNAATAEGPCLKGLSYVERVHSKQRILRPLARKRDGLVEISWEEALDGMAERLLRLQRDPGPQSVFYYAASGTKGLLNEMGMRFWRMFGGCTTSFGDLCWPSGLEATRLSLGANEHNAPWDLENAGLMIMWGKNAAETNIHQMAFVEKALSRGAELIVIDPRRTQTAERADLLVQIRPGTDGALALGIAHCLVRDDLVDHEFIKLHVSGYPAFADLVKDFSPGRVAEISEVPERWIEHLAQRFATAGPVTICAGFGMQRYTNSGQCMRAMIALLAITGNIGKPGAGWQFANLQTAIFDEIGDPLAFYPPERPDGSVRVSISTARLGRDMLATTDPPLKMAWVERGNPVTQNPETNTVLEAFRSLDYRVVVEQFLTDTAREADLVLPAKTLFEQSDVIGAYWHPYIQLKQKLMEPPGEVRPESEIYRSLALRLGMDAAAVSAAFPGPSDRELDAWLEDRLRPWPELSLQRLRQAPVLAPGHKEVAFADKVFPTPSGKIELFSQEAVRRWKVDALPLYTESEESPRSAKELAARYPLFLMTPNTKNRIHSQFHNLDMIRQLDQKPVLQMHPLDARERKIRGGDRVMVGNDRGKLELEASMDFGMKPGCVCVSNGWWLAEGGGVNVCSLGRETDMGHGAAFHDNLVQVEKLS